MTGFSADTTREYIELYFESGRATGSATACKVKIDYDPHQRIAIVRYENPEGIRMSLYYYYYSHYSHHYSHSHSHSHYYYYY